MIFIVDNRNIYCEWFCPFGATKIHPVIARAIDTVVAKSKKVKAGATPTVKNCPSYVL